MIMVGKNMCDYCSNIKKTEDFSSPKLYEETIEYIKDLVENRGFIVVEGSCKLGEHKKDGHWIDDIIYHIIKCPKCGKRFTCTVNTYRGGGSFE